MSETLTVYRCPEHGLVKFAGASDRCLEPTRHGQCAEVCVEVQVQETVSSQQWRMRCGPRTYTAEQAAFLEEVASQRVDLKEPPIAISPTRKV